MAFRPMLEELHIIVFSRTIEQESISRDDGTIIYHFKRRSLLLDFFSVWHSIVFNLTWRRRFRPDIVVSWNADASAFFSWLLTRRFKKSLFLVLDSHYLELRRFSLRRFILNRALERATAVVVPGEETAKEYTRIFHVPPAAIIAAAPPVDAVALTESKHGFNFHEEHAQYNFFVITTLYKKHDLMKVLAIHSRVSFKYPRTGFIILAPKELVKEFETITAHQKQFGVFFYPLDDSYLSYIQGAHVYLGVGIVEDVDKGILSALGSGIPVVTAPVGIARELFADPQFAQFMSRDESADSIAAILLSLIEQQQVRTQYALTTSLLFSKVHSITPEQYSKNLFTILDEMVQPTLVDPMRPVVQTPSEETQTHAGN
jgi:hypothetical protein